MREGDERDPGEFGIGHLFWVTSEAIVVADLQTERVVLWNGAAERLFGYRVQEAIGMPLEQLVPDELRERHLAGIRRYRATTQPVLVGSDPVDLPALTKLGEQRDIALTLTDVTQGDGQQAGRYVLAVIRDVTGQRTAERELEAANQTLRNFVAAAAHDLRSPLTAIEGFTTLLIEHGDQFDEARAAESLTTILRSARHASRLVADLLTLSQIQLGGIAVRAEPVAVAAAARRAVQSTGSAASVEVDDTLTVMVDADHLDRILSNLLTNAARYGAPPIQILGGNHGSFVEVRVVDHGAGPPQEFRSQLFTPFARVSHEREGTGLGLSIVSGLAEANDGSAFFDDAEGIAFGVRLPAPPRV